MTVQALLSKLSGRTPRFVTIDGRVIDGTGVTMSGSSFTHTDHGHVTKVRPHTFHGGNSPEEGATTMLEPPGRDAEAERMAVAFPQFEAIEIGGLAGWEGDINTGRGSFRIRVLHTGRYPIPSIEVLHPRRLERPAGRRRRNSPHLYDSGLLCVAEASDWDLDCDDAVTAVAWAAHWLAAYTEWRITGRWPESGAR